MIFVKKTALWGLNLVCEAEPTINRHWVNFSVCRCHTPDYTPLETMPGKILGSTRIYPGVDFRPGYPESTPPSGSTPHPLSWFAEVSSDSRLYPSFPEYTPLFNTFVCATLPESTRPSQDILPFSTTVWDHSRIYPSLPEYTPIFNKYFIMRSSQNLPLSPRIYPPFQHLK